MRRSENVATPFTATRRRVPDSVPPPGLEPMVIQIPPVKPVTRTPPNPSTSTWSGGEITSPARTVDGRGPMNPRPVAPANGGGGPARTANAAAGAGGGAAGPPAAGAAVAPGGGGVVAGAVVAAVRGSR